MGYVEPRTKGQRNQKEFGVDERNKGCWVEVPQMTVYACFALLGYSMIQSIVIYEVQNVEFRATQQVLRRCPSLAGEHFAVGIDGDTIGHASLGTECEPDPGVVEDRLRYFGELPMRMLENDHQ